MDLDIWNIKSLKIAALTKVNPYVTPVDNSYVFTILLLLGLELKIHVLLQLKIKMIVLFTK